MLALYFFEAYYKFAKLHMHDSCKFKLLFSMSYNFKIILDDIVLISTAVFLIFCILEHSHRPSSTNSSDRRIYAIASHDGHIWYSNANAT